RGGGADGGPDGGDSHGLGGPRWLAAGCGPARWSARVDERWGEPGGHRWRADLPDPGSAPGAARAGGWAGRGGGEAGRHPGSAPRGGGAPGYWPGHWRGRERPRSPWA